MANDTSGSPWILNTVGVVYKKPVTVLKMEWKPNAADDSLQVGHASGQLVWTATALTGGQPGIEVWEVPEGFVFSGFNLVSVGTSASLYVWVK
jgi:hypothetical protein